MNVDLFDFELPESHIALRPLVPREAAKLLVVDESHIPSDFHIGDLPQLLRAGDALVFNDTKVIPARLEGTRTRGEAVAHIGATLHMRMSPNSWKAFVRPAKRLNEGEIIVFSKADQRLEAQVSEKGEAGEMLLTFDKSGAELDSAIAFIGHMPLPPYIAARRGEDAQDTKDYQTVFAREEGAVAAPTAGLHFTNSLLDSLKEKGLEQHFVTLHVGAGTFLPVKVDDTIDHKMHSEIGHISQEVADHLNAVRARGGRIVAVGTTALRLLESAAKDDGSLAAWSGATDIFITPGYRFKIVDQLITNFHLPRSTLFMLVSAFAGLDVMKNAYMHAIDNDYRFYSYGDSSLLTRNDDALKLQDK
ncbi:tRNA preQ1(34) S-adenosylmethionine ribosyltransferase-isomerase QueA [Bartonella sp. HY038]|uniref:tRNA preQ1(34) S-adenosylmethionine ribosyltransferase-isomerase QueA n=1 Tax=Bartonella sp. HY038 TaxID=2759660 RepID=UPI0015F8F2E1|nr:tRNA preQ1(34) S-adenosylmethionine ribosyltransferase-isomerase QueA [Bartonella sp. HY038]